MKKILSVLFLFGLFICLGNLSHAENGITYNNNLATRTDLNGNVFKYGSITVEYSGNSITIMDRNLGATTNDINSPDSYGYYYQRGNNYGFNGTEPKSKNRISDTAAPYYSSTFIAKETFRDNSYNNNLWGGSKDEENLPQTLEETLKNTPDLSVRQGPCPEGWHIPSIGEWIQIVDYLALNNNLKSIHSGNGLGYLDFRTYGLKTINALKLPYAGVLTPKEGAKRFQGDYGNYRSSSAGSSSKNTFSPILDLNNGTRFSIGIDTGRSSGYSVRCFKNNTTEGGNVTGKEQINDTPTSTNTQITTEEGKKEQKNTDEKIEENKPETNDKSNNSRYQDGNQSEMLSNGYSREINNAYNFALNNRITTINDINKADMNGSLTRIAMAKMLSQYAINILGKTPDTSKLPNFTDVSIKIDADYNNGATLAYQLGIMGMGLEKFRPYDLVTRAEFGTALSRMLYETPDGQGTYYSTHLSKLKSEGIINNDNPNLKELRGYVMLMLMRSAE